jgi:hypothetical protein
VYVATLDTIGLKRTMEQLDRLAQDVPSLRTHAALGRAEYYHLKGEHEQAFAIVSPILAATADRSFFGRTSAVVNHARALNRLGRHAEAKDFLQPFLAGVSDDDLTVVMIYPMLHRELAHAQAGLGDHGAAFATIDRLLERYTESKHPLLLGNLHASAAAIAVDAGDTTRALEHVSHMEHWFRPTGNPALIGQCERMLRQVRRMVDGRAGEVEALVPEASFDDGGATARSMLSQCRGSEQRAEFALGLLLSHVRGATGFLFSYQHGDLSLIAPQHGQEPGAELIARIESDIRGHTADEDVTVVTKSPGSASLPPPMPDTNIEDRYRTYLLTIPGRDEVRVVGALAVSLGERPLRAPQQSFMQTVARTLFESGDGGSTETRVR